MSVQSMQALETGNASRLGRARLRRDIAAGRADWREVIGDPPPCIGDMLLSEVLMHMMPGLGRITVETLGKRAFNDGLTLTVRARKASTRTRLWLLEEAAPLIEIGLGRVAARRARSHGTTTRKAIAKRVQLP